MDRRQFIQAGSAASVLGVAAGCASTGGGSGAGGNVVVVGGGYGGATAAKYIRMWSEGRVNVTLVEPNDSFISCPISNLVIGGSKQMADITTPYDNLAKRHGVKIIKDRAVSIDAGKRTVTLAGGTVLPYDRLVLSPGIEFMWDALPGLKKPGAQDKVLHSWKAGPQTVALRRQLEAMPDGGVYALTIPLSPYRCPPGPYERACLLADWLKVNKPRSKLLVLEADADIVAAKDNCMNAFLGLHGGVIEYHNNAEVLQADAAGMNLQTTAGNFHGDVINPIPRQRAGAPLAKAGLNNATEGRFGAVDVLSYASTVAGAGKVHIIGDASATTQPKAGHIANQEAKVCADAIARLLSGRQPDPAPVTNSSCYSTITMTQAWWLHAVFQYDAAARAMAALPTATGASAGCSSGDFKDMNTWFNALMADSFA